MKLEYLGIVVRDMKESLRFYGLLGLPTEGLDPKEEHVECTLSNGMRIAWETVELIKKIDANWKDPVGQGMAIAFACDSPAEVDAAYQKVIHAGFKGYKEPWDAFWGQRYATVIDPNGNTVDLFAWLAKPA